MKFYLVNRDYVSALKEIESRVEDVNYGNHLRPHLGVVLKVNDYNYYVPLCSPKPRHDKMSNQLDFLKLHDKNGSLLAVLNFNNMIPVPEKFLTEINNKTIEKLRKFKNNSEKNNYIYLLNKEMDVIDSINKNNSINERAHKLYIRKLNYPLDRISKRCCEFKKLEKICDLFSD